VEGNDPCNPHFPAKYPSICCWSIVDNVDENTRISPTSDNQYPAAPVFVPIYKFAEFVNVVAETVAVVASDVPFK
jgi:hypothetical protein